MKKLTTLLGLVLLSFNAQSSATHLPPSTEDSMTGVGIPKLQFCNTGGTEYFYCSPVQQLPASFAHTSADAFDDSMVAAGCSKLDERRFHCKGDVFQWGGDSVWWRFKKNGSLTTTYVYIYD